MTVPAGESLYYFCYTFESDENIDNSSAYVKMMLTSDAVEAQKIIDAAADITHCYPFSD